MDDSKLVRKDKNLTAARFENLLGCLDADRESAAAKYEDLRWQLSRFFEWNCAHEAEDLVDETLDRLAAKLENQAIQDIVPFAWGIAANVRLEANRKAARMVPIPGSLPNQGFPDESRDTEEQLHAKIDQERRLRCLQMCIQRLPEPDAKLFVAYYGLDEDPVQARQKLAVRLGITMNALRVRVNRIRDKVERCALRCMSGAGVSTVDLLRKWMHAPRLI